MFIVGAGPTGLALACELARFGVTCRLIDKAPHRSVHSKALGIQARTLEQFERLGIIQEVVDLGLKAHAVNMYADGKSIAHISFDELDSPFPFMLILPQSETERILTNLAESLGIAIERSVEMTGFTQDPEGVTTTLRHSDGTLETVRSRWLAGCDGAHSTVRHGLGLSFEGTAYPQGFLLADVDIQGLPAPDEAHIFLHESGLLAIFPYGNGKFRIIADQTAETSELPEEPTLLECQSVVDLRGPGDLILSDPSWMSRFRIHERIAANLQVERVFLVGDSAHIHSPAGGQGMNTGIQDAGNLAWKIGLVAHGSALPALLATYQEERYPVDQSVLRNTDILTKNATLQSPVAQYVRNHLLPILSDLEVVRQRVRRTISEIAVEYRHSSIVEDHHGSTGPHAGDRVPDASGLQPATGNPMRLYTLLPAARHTLLLFTGLGSDAFIDIELFSQQVHARYGDLISTFIVVPQEAIPACFNDLDHIILDPEQTAHIAFGITAPCLYLVRPDAYIAFRSPFIERQYLSDYLLRLIV